MAALPILSAAAAASSEQGWQEQQFYHEGVVRQYRYWVPDDLEKPAPVVLLLHDGGETMHRVLGEGASGNKAWLDLAREERLVLLLPNGTNLRTGEGRGQNLHWNDCRPDSKRLNRRSGSDDVAFVRRVIESLSEQHPVDLSRVYATGSGEGGLMAMRLAFEAADVIAAVASINASLPLNTDCERSRVPIPMVLMNSTQDPRFRWNGGHVGGRHGLVMSVPRMRALLTSYNWARADATKTVWLPDLDVEDGCTVERIWIPASARGADLCFLTIHGGGHALPSVRYGQSQRESRRNGAQCRDIEMAEELWKFLQEYSLAQ